MLTIQTRPHFHTLLDALTLQKPDNRSAIIYVQTGQEPITVSRQAFCEKIVDYAAALQQLDIRPADLVVIAHTQSLESIYAFWGAMLVGAIPSMFPTLTEKLDAAVYMHNMAELVRLSNVRAVLTPDEFAANLRPQLPCPVFGTAEINAETQRRRGTKGQVAGHRSQVGNLPISQAPSLKIPNLQSPIASSEIAFLQHSSGTTGLQKGVALSNAAVLNQLAAYGDSILLHEDDVVVSWLPLYHDMGLIAGFLLPLVQGIPLVLMSPFDWVQHPALLFRAIHDYRGTLCWLPNFAYNHCARRIRRRDLEGLSAASMRLFINCSEPVRHDSHQLFLERFAANGVRPEMLTVSYAMAENTFAVTQTTPGRPPPLDTIDQRVLAEELRAKPVAADHPQAEVRVSCGRPIPGTRIRIVDNNNIPLAERQVGEIEIISDCLLTGYYNRPDLQPFQDGWYQTGDRGYVADGELYVIGRSKDLIINAGKNIYPQDIEAIVNNIPGVHPGRVVAFGVPDKREGTELVVVVAELAERQRSREAEETERLEIEEVDDAKKLPSAIPNPQLTNPIESAIPNRQSVGRLIRQEVARQAGVTVSYVHLVEPKWLLKTSSGKLARAANREKWLGEVRK